MPRVISPARARLELTRRRRVRETGLIALERSVKALSPNQKKFFLSKHKRRVAIAGRQSGKTHMSMMLLVQAALEPNTLNLYFAPTRNAARSIVWEKLKRWLRDSGVAVAFNESLLEARFGNGSIIRLLGVPDMVRAERHRGLTVNGVVVVDEAAFFREEVFEHLVTSIIPAYFMTTKQNLVCVSSPGLTPTGRFHRIATDTTMDWNRHVFTVHDNPIIRDKDAALAELREANGWTLESAGYLREGLAQWVIDTELGVYELTTDANVIEELPTGPWTTVLAFDQGGGGENGDPDVIGVLGWREHDPALYLLQMQVMDGNDVTDLAEALAAMRQEWKPTRIIGDLGALGKKTALEMQNRHRLPVEAADKHGKVSAIRQFNADARRGLVKLLKGEPVIEQMQRLRWDSKHVGVKEHPAMPNDMCDVLLYGHRMSRHFRALAAPKPEAPRGSEQWRQEEHLKMKAAALAKAEADKRQHSEGENLPPWMQQIKSDAMPW